MGGRSGQGGGANVCQNVIDRTSQLNMRSKALEGRVRLLFSALLLAGLCRALGKLQSNSAPYLGWGGNQGHTPQGSPRMGSAHQTSPGLLGKVMGSSVNTTTAPSPLTLHWCCLWHPGPAAPQEPPCQAGTQDWQHPLPAPSQPFPPLEYNQRPLCPCRCDSHPVLAPLQETALALWS